MKLNRSDKLSEDEQWELIRFKSIQKNLLSDFGVKPLNKEGENNIWYEKMPFYRKGFDEYHMWPQELRSKWLTPTTIDLETPFEAQFWGSKEDKPEKS